MEVSGISKSKELSRRGQKARIQRRAKNSRPKNIPKRKRENIKGGLRVRVPNGIGMAAARMGVGQSDWSER